MQILLFSVRVLPPRSFLDLHLSREWAPRGRMTSATRSTAAAVMGVSPWVRGSVRKANDAQRRLGHLPALRTASTDALARSVVAKTAERGACYKSSVYLNIHRRIANTMPSSRHSRAATRSPSLRPPIAIQPDDCARTRSSSPRAARIGAALGEKRYKVQARDTCY